VLLENNKNKDLLQIFKYCLVYTSLAIEINEGKKEDSSSNNNNSLEYKASEAKASESRKRVEKLKEHVNFTAQATDDRVQTIKNLLEVLEKEYPEIVWLREDDVNETPELQVTAHDV
jgi:hypothetical protein